MSTSRPAYVALPASDLRVGHCVIANEVDRPFGRLVAVIESVEGDTICVKYLNYDLPLALHSERGMVCLSEYATPCEHFGVQVRYADGEYWCTPVAESTATYPDGRRRQWQEYRDACPFPARPDVLAVCRAVFEEATVSGEC